MPTPEQVEKLYEAAMKAPGDVQGMLDDLVYDVSSQKASNKNNEMGATMKEFEQNHDDADESASNINNGGYSEQIAYLLREGFSYEELMKKINDEEI